MDKPIEIAEGIFWVGYHEPDQGLQCNPYLLIDGQEAILFEPGGVLHFPVVKEKVLSLVKPEQISTIIVSHQDPDLCASIPLFEKLLPKVKVVTHSRASVLSRHYGIQSEFYHVDQNNWELELESGRKLEFHFTPYLHFPGAFVTFDPQSGVLFSGDLFGAFSFDWQLFANEDYPEAVKAFHENYMPAHTILEEAMKRLEELPIRTIAPQHGSVIRENVPAYLKLLRELDCGDYMLY